MGKKNFSYPLHVLIRYFLIQGERLSHAVGCAFAICLEKKQQRDKLCAVSMSVDPENNSFTRYGSFRQATLTERLADPQGIKPGLDKQPAVEPSNEENPFAVARPHATDLMLARQTSFRGLGQLGQNSPFKRQLSLRVNDLPSNLERKTNESNNSSLNSNGNHSSTIDTLEEVFNSGDSLQVLKNNLSHLYQMSNNSSNNEAFDASKFESIAEEAEAEPEPENNEDKDPIGSMCQRLSQELVALSATNNEARKSSQSLNKVDETETAEVETTEAEAEFRSLPVQVNNEKADPLANVKPVQYDNPWDFVPDQPNNNR